MMNQDCPDAPYIREAELCGMPHPDEVFCPFCEKRCDMIYIDKDGYAFACDRCVRHVDATWWDQMNKEEEEGN